MDKTCKICGETKPAIKGVWVIQRGKPAGKVCTNCRNILQNTKNATPEGKAKVKASNTTKHTTPAYKASHAAYIRRLRDTDIGLEKIRAIGRKAQAKLRATEDGRAKYYAACAQWRLVNPDKACALTMKRRAAKLYRTPKWADLEKISAIYKQAARLTKATGIPHHVDHIIPLRGKLVSGLHVENNLQILTAVENSQKSNKFSV